MVGKLSKRCWAGEEMISRVSMREEMTWFEAGRTLTLFTGRFLGAVAKVLVGNDFRLPSGVRTEVRGGIRGGREAESCNILDVL